MSPSNWPLASRLLPRFLGHTETYFSLAILSLKGIIKCRSVRRLLRKLLNLRARRREVLYYSTFQKPTPRTCARYWWTRNFSWQSFGMTIHDRAFLNVQCSYIRIKIWILQFVSTRKLWNNILHMTYMWNIKKNPMHWWFRVFWHTHYSIDVSSLFYNHNKRLNRDGGHVLEMLHVLDSGWDHV